jgi:hypothetical protein
VTGHDKEPMPTTPSKETERPEGVSFDIPKGADTSGMPTEDQTPQNPEAAEMDEAIQETGGGPPAGAAIPGDQTQKADKLLDE